jgi:NAD+ synthase (glutamine-hydrolysing)
MWKNTLDPSFENSNLKKLQNADIAINISASSFDYTATTGKKEYLKQLAFESKTPVVYCNATGAQAGIILEGGSMVYDDGGYESLSLKKFEEDKAVITISDNGTCATESITPVGVLSEESFNMDQFTPHHNISQIRKAIVSAIRDYFDKLGLKKALIGNSGGIDSAVTTALATEALGKKNVFNMLMPSKYSTKGSISDGEQLCKNLKIGYEITPIKSLFSKFIQTLEPIFKGAPVDVTEENIQARIRAILLMAFANKFNYVLLNTSNKSELCVGYGTMYGDLAGGLSVLGDCYKMQVYELAKDINQAKEIIPQNTIDKAPSAELHPGQLDSDTLPRYEVLDRILYQYIDRRKQIQEITRMGYREDIVKKIISMVNKNEFKRHQFCPIIGISPMPFGIGRRIPIVAKYSK